MRTAFGWILALSLPAIFCLSAFSAEKITDAQRKFFENKIRPILVESCYKCHATGAKKIGANLLLDSAPAIEMGGESGSPVVAGKPDESLLIHALKWEDDLEMPPKEPLPESVIADFKNWIEMGAPDPRSKAVKLEPRKAIDYSKYKEGDLWSFQPVAKPETDATIDLYISKKWEEHDLKPAPAAEPRVLMRRLYFDLIGLPPNYSDQEKFVIDYQADRHKAVADLVDELLALPAFGERWGRHWLDVARYAESNGNDGLSRNASFPNAWRYRDYVIGALNRDVPYDRFLTEQIAGDLLEAADDRARDNQLIATGFLAIGSKPAKAMNNNFFMDVVADQIDVIGSGVIGLSVACARCHDHKFDPIPTRDYYAMAGFFTSSETLWGIAANEKLTAPPTQLHVLKSYPNVPAPPEALKLNAETEAKEMRNYPRPKKEFTYPPGTPVAMGVRDKNAPADCKLNIKGDAKKLGGVVPRGFLSAYANKELARIKVDSSGSGRKDLARWLTSPQHPQTARVMVNRIWLHLFGEGIVRTPNDFGVYGDKPTHPELLDYLAHTFVNRHNWSIKSMIREIVLSKTYQLSGPQSETTDPENRWLSYHSQRRLDAESLRDSILKVSGNLIEEPADGSPIRHLDLLVNRAPNLHQESHHRSIYLCLMRNSPPPELAAFDLPDAIEPLGQRNETMLPTQALFLLNSSFVIEQAEAIANTYSSLELDDRQKVEKLWQQILNRIPEPTELAEAIYLLERTTPRAKAWSTLSQALLATNEFRYVD